MEGTRPAKTSAADELAAICAPGICTLVAPLPDSGAGIAMGVDFVASNHGAVHVDESGSLVKDCSKKRLALFEFFASRICHYSP